MKHVLAIVFIIHLCFSCSHKETYEGKAISPPEVVEGGKKILLPDDSVTLSFFSSDTVRRENIEATLSAPATVAVAIVSSLSEGKYTVLFDNPELEATYSQFLQRLININTYRINLNRVIDLAKHGAASGKEVLDARTQLGNEEAALTQQEGELKIAGLDPETLKNPESEQVWLLSEIPEIQIGSIKIGTPCRIHFTAYPDRKYDSKVDGISPEVDKITRMNKIRVVLPNASGKFQVGMFAQIDFKSDTMNTVVIPISAVVNVQGKDYVFIHNGKTVFERRQILTGFQSDDKIVVLNGLKSGERIAVKGAIELKGLSFGY